ncbi:MAG: hypothetical protein H6702_00425 [Myxococcales bacterium]|nr:hypothetical protein [Myxococcales bacterium]
MTRHTKPKRRPGWLFRLGVALVAVAFSAQAWAITVDNVVQMHKSGLPPAVIIQTIQSTGSTFNLSAADKKALEDAGVPADVVQAMSGSAGGAPAPAPEPAPEPAPDVGGGGEGTDDLERLREQEAAERARIEEEARIREAARRAADQEREKMRAEERKRVARALASARSALDDGRYYEAARSFDEFIKSTADQTKPSVQSAKLGLADALKALKLYGNAAGIYHELLAAGPDSEVFEPAFKGLRTCSRMVAYNPVTLEALTNYFVGNFSQGFQDDYNYFLGKFFFDYNRNDEATRYLGEVSEKADDFAEAQYLMGLVGVQSAGEDAESSDFIKNLVKANVHFQKAILGASRSDDARVKHLAYLALARIAYTLEQYDAAIFYYRKVPADSTSYVNALHESAWSYFLKGDTTRGMGIFHTLDGPDWEDYFLPDTYLLEATVFTNVCRFDYAREAIERIRQRYLALKMPLGQYLAEYASPDALYQAFVLKQTRKGVELPRLVRMSVISNPEFYDLYTSVTAYRREVARLKRERENFGADLAARLLATVESRQQERTLALGIKLNQILQKLDDELSELEVQVTEIRIEIDEAAADELEKEIAKANQDGDTSPVAAAQAQESALVFVGDKYVTWPFEGEYWSDEINNYRSYLTEVCK